MPTTRQQAAPDNRRRGLLAAGRQAASCHYSTLKGDGL
jgi:hypothetical protein